MKTTLLPSEIRVSPDLNHSRREKGTPDWEYCFLLQDQSGAASSELTELSAAGWRVVSFRTRFDNHREYLLKRPRL